jgi:hypothetical protein
MSSPRAPARARLERLAPGTAIACVALLGAATGAGCGGAERAEPEAPASGPSAAAWAPVPTSRASAPPEPVPAPPPEAPAPRLTGVPECDDYLQKIRACIERMPPEVQGAMTEAIDHTQASWVQMGQSPGTLGGLGAACTAANDAIAANPMCRP